MSKAHSAGRVPIVFCLSMWACMLPGQQTLDTAQPVRVDESVMANKLTKQIPPLYPPLANSARIQGSVVLTVHIGKDGSVSDTKLVRGHPLLVSAAVEAVKQWQYSPFLVQGEPVEVITTVTVPFNLADVKTPDVSNTPTTSGSNALPAEQWPIPKTAEDFVRRGYQYMRERKYREAIDDSNAALKMIVDYLPALRLRATANYGAKNYDAAIKDYSAILESSPNWPEIHTYRGLAYSYSGHHELALPDYTKAIELDPYVANPYNARGWAYLEMGEYDKAVPDLNRAIELLPEFVRAYENRAKLLDKTNDLQSELADLDMILRISPSSQWAKGQRDEVLRRIGSARAQEREKAAETKSPQDLMWTDPSTGLMWTKEDNGIGVSWDQAKKYCSDMRVRGFSDWRLPTIDELSAIYDPTQNVDGYHIKGGIRLGLCCTWSSSTGLDSGQVWLLHFIGGGRVSGRRDYPFRVLCVRGLEK